MEMDPKNNKDNKYLDGLVAGDAAIMEEIYGAFAKRISRMILNSGGNMDEARDIFQEALRILIHKKKVDNFYLKGSFYNYLHGICRNIFLKQIHKKEKDGVISNQLLEVPSEKDEDLDDWERWKLFNEKIKELPESCQLLLKLDFAKKSATEIMEIMNMSSTSYVGKRKFQCKKKLIEIIQSDPRYSALKFQND